MAVRQRPRKTAKQEVLAEEGGSAAQMVRAREASKERAGARKLLENGLERGGEANLQVMTVPVRAPNA